MAERTENMIRRDENAVRADLAQDNKLGMTRSQEIYADRQLDGAVTKLSQDAASVSPAEAQRIMQSMRASEPNPLVKIENGQLVFDNFEYQKEKGSAKIQRAEQKGTNVLNGIEKFMHLK